MNTNKVWKEVLTIIENNTTPISFDTWIKPIFVYKIDNDLKIVYLSTSEDYIIKIVKNRYIHLLEQSFKDVLQENYKVVIKLNEDYKKNEPSEKKKVVNKNIFNKDKIFNPRLNFDNFVVGNSNKYAHAASLQLQNPLQKPIILYLYMVVQV